MSSLFSGNSISSYASNGATAENSDRLATDKSTFLKLLVAQLTYQDPLNPTDDTEFITQLAQFSTLEQLQEINESVQDMNTTVTQGRMMSATSYIGKDVMVSGNQITKQNNADGDIVTSMVYYTVGSAIAKGQFTVYNSDMTKVIFNGTIPAMAAGTGYVSWDGKDNNGNEVANDVYKVIVSAQDDNDKAVLVDTQFTARVFGITNVDGAYYLSLDGSRSVLLTDVTAVVDAEQTVTSVTTQADAAADACAAASLAATSAATAEAEALATSDPDEAKSAAKTALTAAKRAIAAAESAADAMNKARTAAQAAETAESLKIYESAKEWSEKAANYATAAEASAENAKTAAEGLGATFDSSEWSWT